MAVSPERIKRNKRSYAGYIGWLGGVPAAPTNKTPPSISGTARVGETLTANDGTWDGIPAPTYTRQWEADGAAISGATGQTYTLTAAEEGARITVTVTATNSEGSASATSPATDPVAPALAAPTNTTPPSISGIARVGETLTASDGVWTGVPTPVITRQWEADGVDIEGATGTTYDLTEAEEGAVITVTVTATNSEGSASATSPATDPVAPAADGGDE